MASKASASLLRPGERIERYRVVAVLGTGATSRVYEAVHEFTGRTVAIKVLSTRELPHGPEMAARAQLEIQRSCQVAHPNVIEIYEAGITSEGADLFVATERLDGLSLRELLDLVGPLGVFEVLDMGVQVARGLAAAHSREVFHRDLRPEHVMLVAGHRFKVLDFGIAKLVGDGFGTADRFLWRGTPLYLSPEHLQHNQVDARSDVFALGTMLDEALTGRHPCLEGAEAVTFAEIGRLRVSRVPTLPSEVVPEVPLDLARLVARAVAKEPAARFQSAAELESALVSVAHRYAAELRAGGREPEIRDLLALARGAAVGTTSMRLSERSVVFGCTSVDSSADTEPWRPTGQEDRSLGSHQPMEPIVGRLGGSVLDATTPIIEPTATGRTSETRTRQSPSRRARRSGVIREWLSGPRSVQLAVLLGVVVAVPLGVSGGLLRRHWSHLQQSSASEVAPPVAAPPANAVPPVVVAAARQSMDQAASASPETIASERSGGEASTGRAAPASGDRPTKESVHDHPIDRSSIAF